MDTVPVYACRIKGTCESWHKVLAADPWWPKGWAAPQLSKIGADRAARTYGAAASAAKWAEYARTRTQVAPSASLEAAATIVRNRQAILKDSCRRRMVYGTVPYQQGTPTETIDEGLRALVWLLITEINDNHEAIAGLAPSVVASTRDCAAYMSARMCVPRDMGMPAALEVHRWHAALDAWLEKEPS